MSAPGARHKLHSAGTGLARNQRSQVTYAAKTSDLRGREPNVMFPLDRQQQPNVGQAVPAIDVTRRHVGAQAQIFVVEKLAKDLAKQRLTLFRSWIGFTTIQRHGIQYKPTVEKQREVVYSR